MPTAIRAKPPDEPVLELGSNIVVDARAIVEVSDTCTNLTSNESLDWVRRMKAIESVYNSWLDIDDATTSVNSLCLPIRTTSWTDSGTTDAARLVWSSDSWLDAVHTTRTYAITHESREPGHPLGRPCTPEEAAKWAAKSAKRAASWQTTLRKNARMKRFRESANARARNLLMSMLDDTQRQEMEEENHFRLTVHSRDGSQRTYLIEYGFQGNVKLLDAHGRPTKRYCIHADSRLPYEDQMLAQKLLLEADEDQFVRTANVTNLRAA